MKLFEVVEIFYCICDFLENDLNVDVNVKFRDRFLK